MCWSINQTISENAVKKYGKNKKKFLKIKP